MQLALVTKIITHVAKMCLCAYLNSRRRPQFALVPTWKPSPAVTAPIM